MSIEVDDKAAKVSKKAMHAPEVLNEAYNYDRPSSFSRGMRVDICGVTMLFISGTASVNEAGESVHEGDFFAQARRTFQNITSLLGSEGATWHDVVRTTCYLKDMHDYDKFNQARTQFYSEQGLDPLPASTCVEAHLCRDELLVEIEAIAVFPSDREK
jgi:enamine deaminase RidA (YjgF/YER057c/UK114 family)